MNSKAVNHGFYSKSGFLPLKPIEKSRKSRKIFKMRLFTAQTKSKKP